MTLRSDPDSGGHPTNAFEPFPRVDLGRSISARFERQVARAPGRLAVKMGRDTLTYAELDHAANRIAQALLDRLGPGNEPVVLLLPQGLRQIAAVLGALKARKIYVPLDPAHPAPRLREAIGDSSARLVLTADAHAPLAHAVAGEAALLVAETLDESGANAAPGLVVAPDAGAYIFYTSGSTGRPKGVLDTHRNVLHNVMRYTNSLHLTADDRLTLLQGPAFSGAVSSLFGALLNGAACFPFDVGREGPDRVPGWLAAERITVYHSVPALFRQVAPQGATLHALRLVRLEGDGASRRDLELFQRHFARDCVLVNGLGATECGLVRQFFFTPEHSLPEGVVPIGEAVGDMEIVLVGADGQEVPGGTVGEIIVRSRYLAAGYWRRPELTAERFPEAGPSGRRVYRTGDAGRLGANGILEHLGRLDGLVKVRGQRVEVAEVESALLTLPGVTEAAVTVREDTPGESRLVAYLVAGAAALPKISSLRRTLAGLLPDYMVPSAFVTLARLPLSDNRKVDRRALPAPGPARPALDTLLVPPRTEDERTLVALWRGVLHLEEIGVEDDFFDLGGDSLLGAIVLVRVLDAFRVEIALTDFAACPTVAALAERIDAARAMGSREPAASIPSIPREPGTLLPTSFAQERLWLVDRLDPGQAVYNTAVAWRLAGPLEVPALERSLQRVVDRHEALRTVFSEVDGVPRQRVLDRLELPLPLIDVAALPAEAREAEARRRVLEGAREPFSLSRGPLLRARLLRLAAEEHVLLIAVHHIVSDGWSMDVLRRELRTAYAAATTPSAPDLPALAIQYADYAAWQRERLQGKPLEGLLAYWRERIGDRPPLLALPTDRPRPARPAFRGARAAFSLPSETTAALRALGRSERATLYMTLLAGFALLLHRHTGQTELIVGSPVATRPRSETEGLIGLFLNTLVLRIDLDGQPTFRELLRRVREVALEAFAHGELPYERLVGALRLDRSPGVPLLSTLFNLHNQPASPLLLEGLSVTTFPVELEEAKFDLNLALEESAQGLSGDLVYDADLFEAATARRLLDTFACALRGVAAEPDRRLGEIPLTPEADRPRLIERGRGPVAPFPRDRAIHELVEAQVDRTPDSVALVLDEERITYRTLDARANRLARRLRALGAGLGATVGICLPRSTDLVVSLLAVLKAGAAYVALDPSDPAPRLRHALDDADARVILTDSRLPTRGAGHGRTVLHLDEEAATLATEDDRRLDHTGDGNGLAYVAYTSGSTGIPKGVPIGHRAVVSYLQYLTRTYALGPEDRVLQLARSSFDVSVREIFGPLSVGGQVVLLSDDAAMDPSAILSHLRGNSVTALLALVPSVMRVLASEAEAQGAGAPHLRLVLTTGEVLLYADVARTRRHLAPRARFVNQYGPTECTMSTTFHPVDPVLLETPGADDADRAAGVPIGRPIANTCAYVLDEALTPVPPGVPGELHIGGIGVATGYLGDAALSAARFVPDPFDGTPGARLYKTGDRARARPDGVLEFLGRIDRQVKVRGIRTEPAETERAFAEHPAVSEVVVLPWEPAPGEQRLAAFVVARPGARADRAELRRYARQRLPAHLVPATITLLAALPLTPNGKLDRRALPAPEPEDLLPASQPVPPRSPLERMMVEIWSEVLRVPRVSVHDDFFDLGGHSLLVAQVVARLRDRIAVELPLRQMFETPTAASLAAAVLARDPRAEERAERRTATPAASRASAPADRPPAPSTLQTLLEAQARRAPASVAISAPGRASLTYRELLVQIEDVRAGLAAAGLGSGSRIAVILPQGPEMATAVIAMAAVAICVPLNPAHVEADLEPMLASARLQAVVTLAGMPGPAHAIAGKLGLPVLAVVPDPLRPAGRFSLALPADGGAAESAPHATPAPDDLAVVLHTSGTTARPKRVPLTHANLLAAAAGHRAALALIPRDRCLNLMPLFHVNGLVMLLASLHAGGSAVCPPRFDASRFYEWLDESSPTWYNATPTIHQAILTQAELDGAAAAGASERSALRLIRSASAPLPSRVRDALEQRFGAPVIESYGQTETATLAAVCPLAPGARTPGSVGRAAGPELAVMNPDGQPLPPDRRGEIVVRGANVMAGYEDDDSRADFAEGWFRTGDLGYLDAEGALFLTGRLKDIINRGGEKIAPREIDEVLLAHPDVRDAVTMGVPHPTLGEDVAAVVSPAPGATLTAAALRHFAASRVADFKVPHRIVLLGEIPRSTSGKPDRAALARVLGMAPPDAGDTRSTEPGRDRPGASASTPVPRRQDLDAPIPLSPSQERLWYLHRLAPTSSAYHLHVASRLRGALDPDALQRSLEALVHRHEALRTVVQTADGAPGQRIEAPAPVPLAVEDLDAPEGPAREGALREALRRITAELIDLERGPLFRARLIRLDACEHVLVLTFHHLISDGWSVRVLAHELETLYRTAREGRMATLAPLPVQFADHVLWQRERLASPEMEPLLAYWRDALGGAPPALTLPTDRPRPLFPTFKGARVPVSVPAGVVEAIRALAREEGATLFMALLAAYQALLARWSEQDTVLVGSPVAGRDRTELEGMVGYLANTVVLRGDLRGDPTFRALLRRTREDTLGAFANQEVPLERLVDTLAQSREPGRNPVFQAMFSMRLIPSASPALAGLTGEPLALGTGDAKVDLTLMLEADDSDGLRGELEYGTDLFDADTIERLTGHWGHLLGEIARDPDRPISRLPLQDAAARRRALADGTARSPYPGDCSLAELFAEQVARTPDAAALEDGGRALDYRALARWADQVARRLRDLGVGRGTRVGICLERSLEQVVATLAVIFAGGAYVPLDPSHPPERLAAMLDDAGARVVVTRAGLAPGVGAGRSALVVDPGDPGAPDSDEGSVMKGDGADLAYVMYTSGSTGPPKGVAVPHRAVARLVRDTDYVRLGPDDVVAHLSNPAFDAATFELWGALLNGARLVVIAREIALAPRALSDALDRLGVTTLFLTTSLFNLMARMAPAAFRGRQVLFGGEAAEARWVEEALRRGSPARLLNLYGPTETTTFATWHEVRAVEPGATTVPIGRPIANTEAHVLDRHREPAPMGWPGELYLGGPGLAEGYLGRPDLTAERFVPHPFDPAPGARLYRTGDCARRRPDGVLDFLGRLDGQVKIRGHRIEPEEVRAALVQLDGVADAAVVVLGDDAETRRLAAYVVPAGDARLEPTRLRDALRQHVPDYLVPASVTLVPVLPLTPNGKLDSAALPAPSEAWTGEAAAPLRPRNPLERTLAAIWEELLGVPAVGVRTSFFDLGGHSLLAARMLDQVERICGRRVPFAVLFAEPSIERLAASLRQAVSESDSPLVAFNPGGSRPPLFFLHGDFSGGGFYCRALAHALGSDQPFYAVHPHGLLDTALPDSIEAMAADRLVALRATRPRGPYLLGGHCNGALVALEMARRLSADGEDVRAVVLLDAVAPRRALRLLAALAAGVGRLPGLSREGGEDRFRRWQARATPALRSLDSYRARVELLGRAGRRGGLRFFAGQAARALIAGLRSASGPRRASRPGEERRPPSDDTLNEAYRRVIKAYVPAPYPGRLIVLRSQHTQDSRPDLGWGLVNERVEVHEVPGDHLGAITRRIEETARRLRDCLEENPSR